MEPLFFDVDGDKLFGVYHPAQDVFSKRAVVICPPIYAEYFRTYRFLRRLADAWAQAGYHVLRFDYFGTGDSAGQWRDAGPQRWISDIKAATMEIQNISGATAINLVGVRFGAALAVLSIDEPDAANELVLWDPIVHGGDYLQSLHNTHSRLLGKVNARSRLHLARLTSDLAGFPREPWVDAELNKIDLNSADTQHLKNIKLIASDKSYLDSVFVQKLVSSGLLVDQTLCEDDCDWGTPSEVAMQAPSILEKLKSCL